MFACVSLSAENMYLLTNAIILWFIHHLFKAQYWVDKFGFAICKSLHYCLLCTFCWRHAVTAGVTSKLFHWSVGHYDVNVQILWLHLVFRTNRASQRQPVRSSIRITLSRGMHESYVISIYPTEQVNSRLPDQASHPVLVWGIRPLARRCQYKLQQSWHWSWCISCCLDAALQLLSFNWLKHLQLSCLACPAHISWCVFGSVQS